MRAGFSLISACRRQFLRIGLRDNPIRVGAQSLFAMIKSIANMSHVIRRRQGGRVSGSLGPGGLRSPIPSVAGNAA